MTFEDLIKANNPKEKPQTGIRVIDKLDAAVVNLIDELERDVAKNNRVPMQTVDAIVKLINVRPKLVINDVEEASQQFAKKFVDVLKQEGLDD